MMPFATWTGCQLEEASLPDGPLRIARGNIVEPMTRFSQSALLELGRLINADARKADFQRFLEEHPEFLMMLGDYVNIHPQVVLRRNDDGPLIPDFFLEGMTSRFCDLCDLKTPLARIVREQRNRLRVRDAVMEAVAQMTVYGDYFEDETNRRRFNELHALYAFRPQAVLIIGRKQEFDDEVARSRLESSLPNWIRLKTYDDVLEKARQWRTLIAGVQVGNDKQEAGAYS